ncbi:MAG: class I SAM-dependent methyltransferase [Pseudomonadota bacterium]
MIKGSISSVGVNDLVMAGVLEHASRLAPQKVSIVEIGAGKGALSQAMRARLDQQNIIYEYDCWDIEPHQINDHKLGFTCRYFDAQEEFDTTKKYDIVIAVEIIEHIENPFHLIREFAKIGKMNSLLLVTSPNILSLPSRLRYFFIGCYDFFRRPYNEYWLNMGHLNPINPLQLIYILRKNGFELNQLTTNYGGIDSLILLPFTPFIALWSAWHYLARERSKGNKEQTKRNRLTFAYVVSLRMLLGKIAIYQAIRTNDLVADKTIWFRSDPNFKP